MASEVVPPSRRSPGLVLLALVVIALSLAYLIISETPRGTVSGVAQLQEGGRPLADCQVYLTPVGAEGTSRRAITDAQGRFLVRRIPAGVYEIAASSRWHASTSSKITVTESETARATLRLKRTEPDINVGQRQTAFATDEKPLLPVRGYVSPKAGARPELKVTIWRTRASEILKRSDAAEALQRLDYTYDGPAAVMPPAILRPPAGVADAPRLVSQTTIPLQYVDREGFYHNRIPLDVARAKPGLYLVRFAHGGKSACSYILVTDMAVVSKRARDEVLAYAVHLRRGTPLAGARVRAYRGGRRLASETADRNGLATLNLPRPGEGEDDARTVLVATRGEDEAVVDRAGQWGGDGGNRYVVHTVTDRTVYRPGDTVQYKGIARVRREGRDGARLYDVPRGVPVTLEMRDPNGGLVQRVTATTSNNGTYWGSVELSPEGATGTYNIIADVAGEKHTRDVAVASYKKPEFSVTVTPTKARYVRGETVEMTVEATYYFGTPVAGSKVNWYAFKDADWASLYGDDLDDDTLREYAEGEYGSYYGEMVESGEVTLDANGKAIVSVPSVKPPTGGEAAKKADDESAFAPQAEVFRVTADVEDASQRTVSGEGSVRVTTGERFVRVEPEGYVASPGKPVEVFVSVRDLDGRPVTDTPVSFSASFQKWDSKTEKTVTTPVGGAQTARTGPDGRALLKLTPPRAGDLRLIATVQDPAGRTVRAESDLWVTGDSGDDLDTDYGDLALLTDKREYAPGETARVLVNTARIGQTVLVTVEGERIYQTLTVPITKRSTVIRVPVRAGWGPNVFLAACYVRDKKFASTTAPLRVAVAARELAVSVTPTGGDKYGPGDTVNYAVETKDVATGKPVSADVALSVVDESIYALRADDPKALRRSFYPRRSQEVSTSYSFAVEYLGDVNKAEPNIAARRRFRDTADWKPDLRTDARGRATVAVTLPDNLTTWRATVQAVTDSTAVGYGVSKVISSKSFFVRLETPRFLTGGDRSRLLALVHNETGQAQSVLVRLVAASLAVDGTDTQTITVPAGGIGKAEWTVAAPATATGAVPLRVTAWTPQAAGQKQFTDGVEQNLAVRAYGRTDFATFAGEVTAGASAPENTTPGLEASLTAGEGPAVLRLDENAVPAETRLTLRVTPSLRGALTGGVEYLIGFPYGCTEQTMSRFYPDLLVQKLGLANPKQAAELPRMVRDGLARLTKLQHESGGWGWWEYDSDDVFMTAYVLTGLAAARELGYPVEDAMIRRGIEAGEKLAQSAPPRDRPFLLYALAEAGYDDAKTNLLHAPFRYSAVRTGLNLDKLPPDALAYLVLLARRIDTDHRPAYNALQRRAVSEGRLTSWKQGKGDYYANGSDRSATALGLRALLAVDPEDRRVPAILRSLMQGRTDGYFGNTRDTAWVLVAFCDYLRRNPEENSEPTGTLDVRLNGKTVQTIDLASDGQGEPEMVLTLPTAALKAGPNTLEVSRSSGSGTVFYSGALRQTIAAPAAGELAALTLPNGIKVEREMLRILPRKAGDDLWRLVTEPVANGVFRQGDRLRVRLKLTVPREASYVLIEDAFPSGAEVTERGTAEEEVSTWSFWYDHVDVRDDRIAYFARRLPAGTHVIEYNLRAQTPGVSRALPTHVEGMYDASVRAESAATRLEVKP